jgi:hypothetical protein
MIDFLVMNLIKTFDALEQSNNQFKHQLGKEKGPLALPQHNWPPQAKDFKNNHTIALEDLARLTKHPDTEKPTLAGIYCVSQKAIELAETLNQAKLDFKQAVLKIRELGKSDKTRVDQLIDKVLKQESLRNPELNAALKKLELEHLDLLKCYAQIKILPPNTQSLTWTWAVRHNAMVQVSQKEAEKMAENLLNPQAKNIAEQLLSSLPKGESLIYRKNLPNRLKANLVWREGKGDNAVNLRKSITISGVALCQDPDFPRLKWKDNPADTDPKDAQKYKRQDRQVNAEPYIKALHLHRYLGEN